MSASQTLSHEEVKRLGRELCISPDCANYEASSKDHHGGSETSHSKASRGSGSHPGAHPGQPQTHELPPPKHGGTPGKETNRRKKM
jgi:hypothetical protein